MSEGIIICLFWLLGWLLLSIGHYVYKVYIDRDIRSTKKLHAWHAFWSGITSWFGIAFWISLYIVYIICEVNDWIEEKLNK